MNNNKAFTLIELLVVVLIIGILAAIGLPQYTKAVGKSRVAEAKINLKALAEAGKMYYLETGERPGMANSDAWAIEKPNSNNWTFGNDECCTGNGKMGCSWEARSKADNRTFIRYWDENYDVICNDSEEPYSGFLCTGSIVNNEGFDKTCKQFGFTKYNEEYGIYLE